MSDTIPDVQATCMEEVFMRIASDLAMVADIEVVVESVEHESMTARPAGEGGVHIAFRVGVVGEEETQHGCLLMPLGEAQVLAASLLMLPGPDVAAAREATELSRTAKDAVLEVGSFVAGATEAALRAVGREAAHIAFEGCQGVRAGVRPRLEYREGEVLVVGRALVSVGGAGPSTWLMLLPEGGLPG
jgi:hypothetical protein